MVRPRKIRSVGFEPGVTYFKPRAVPLNALKEVELAVDELETMRLDCLEGLDQKKAADKMGIHQSTFQRILARARKKVSDALVNGKAIKIQGGDYSMPGKNRTRQIGYGKGLGRMGGQLSAGPAGICACPKCGHEQLHVRGQPCIQTKCEKCGSFMARKQA